MPDSTYISLCVSLSNIELLFFYSVQLMAVLYIILICFLASLALGIFASQANGLTNGVPESEPESEPASGPESDTEPDPAQPQTEAEAEEPSETESESEVSYDGLSDEEEQLAAEQATRDAARAYYEGIRAAEAAAAAAAAEAEAERSRLANEHFTEVTANVPSGTTMT